MPDSTIFKERKLVLGPLYVKGTTSLKKNRKRDDIVHLSNYPHPAGLIVTAEIVTNQIN